MERAQAANKLREIAIKKLKRFCKDKCDTDDIFEISNILIDTDALNKESNLLHAISNPNRLKILKLLRYSELCVCEIEAALNVPQSSTSHHLSVLRESDLVKTRKVNNFIYYRIADALIPEILKLVEELVPYQQTNSRKADDSLMKTQKLV